MIPKIEIIEHYDKKDKDFSCDYYSVDVKIGGKIVRHYSDAYHDRGLEKAEAFVDGYLSVVDPQHIEDDLIKTTRTRRADGKV
jgi:hypothetical protein